MNKALEWLDRLELLAGWAREGRSETEIAAAIGVTPDTLSRWKAKYPGLRAALRENGEQVNSKVENALLKKALGYECVEKKVEISAKGERKEVETTKQIGPDMSAISLWLKKRRPERWGDTPSGSGGAQNNLTELLEEQEGAFNTDGISELQPPADADPDLVET